jgi:hypothetical protein
LLVDTQTSQQVSTKTGGNKPGKEESGSAGRCRRAMDASGEPENSKIKIQNPEEREKLQIPSTKHQRSTKFQASMGLSEAEYDMVNWNSMEISRD